MPGLSAKGGAQELRRVSRYIANGAIATAVHFLCLKLLVEGFELGSAGLANLIAALAGISASFIGSRYFVFQAASEAWLRQAARFAALYAAIAVLHGLVLFLWSDVAGRDYVVGFAIATLLQVSLSYWGNKSLVFK